MAEAHAQETTQAKSVVKTGKISNRETAQGLATIGGRQLDHWHRGKCQGLVRDVTMIVTRNRANSMTVTTDARRRETLCQ
jgi:hypothetical protein